MKWLDAILKQMESFKRSDLKGPKGDVNDGEVVIATLEDDGLRRLFTLYQRKGDEIREMTKKAMHASIDDLSDDEGHDPKTCPGCKLRREIGLMTSHSDILAKIFWTELRTFLTPEQLASGEEKTGSSDIGIRKDWKIVAIPQRRLGGMVQIASLRDLLEVIGGQ